MEIVPKRTASGQQHFRITSSGSVFPRMINQQGLGMMFVAEVFLHAIADDGTVSNVGTAELKFDRPELFEMLLKHCNKIVGPEVEAVMKKYKEMESRIEVPSPELIARLQH